jgi:hypothetical protein
MPIGALRAPPRPSQLRCAAPLKIKIDYFQKQNVFLRPQAPQFKKAPTLFLLKSKYF